MKNDVGAEASNKTAWKQSAEARRDGVVEGEGTAKQIGEELSERANERLTDEVKWISGNSRGVYEAKTQLRPSG